ncbi:ATP-binding protein [Aquabacterium sp.]|uniref:ATP-binding protein n=1 Tax=Aquabacterium sp. TaxID=1872578 RepID=UPI003783400E
MTDTIITDESPTIVCVAHGEQPRVLTAWLGVGRKPTQCGRCVEEFKEAEKQRRREERVEELKDRLNLPARLCVADFDQFVATEKQRQAAARCKAWVEEVGGREGGTLILPGPPGTGKSTLLAACCNHYIEQELRQARMTTQRELIARLRATWRKGAEESEQQVLDDFIRPELVALDDVGVSLGGEAEQVQLLDVVDGRYKRFGSTIIATNLTLPELRDALGERTYDRLQQDATVVICDWPSFRTGGARG